MPGEPNLVAFTGKVATLMAASPGALGGLRGLVHVRSILGNVGVIVLPDQVAVPRAADAFAADGSLKDAKQQASVEGLGKKYRIGAAQERLHTIEQATELGAAVLLPVITERTIARRVNLERLRANAIEAAEQSGRLTVPEIREPQSLSDLLR